MQYALQLSQKARLQAPPNPWVGCVIVQNSQVVGEGWSGAPGEPHAEQVALAQAGERARGATLYSTLEPCCHEGRTPPCTAALIRAGIRRVVCGLTDPDSRVNGGGIAELRHAGITVDVGVEAERVAEELAPYLHHRKTGRPYVVAKAAISLDGYIAAKEGPHQWISGPEAREDVQLLRAHCQAIAVGSGTALADRPRLTVRSYPVKPLRVVLDGRGRLPIDGPLWDKSAPLLIATGAQADETTCQRWRESGAEVVKFTKGIEWPSLLDHLGQRGVIQLLVEGGSQIFSSLLPSSHVQKLVIYVGPKLLGKGVPLATLSQSCSWRCLGSARFGDTVRLDYEPSSGV
jgi:diaminohydroxyphosphoribosylaminopyrimidine deaminase/5-amino-6-(5-phosphoribosylamino)uracil reductase